METKKLFAFKKELKELIKKHNIGIHEEENYNGIEEYDGTDTYFTIDGFINYSETIIEIINNLK